MSKRQFIILLGILLMFLPFLGFPSSWDKIINVAIGLLIVIFSFLKNPVLKNPGGSISQKNDEKDYVRNDQFPFVEHKSE